MFNSKWGSLFIVGLALLLNGCANTATIKADTNDLSGKSIYLVPTGLIKIEGVSSNWGPAFGAIGTLLEQAATADERNAVAAQISNKLSNNDLFNIAALQIRQTISSSTHTKAIIQSTPTQPGMAFEDWFNPNHRTSIPKEINGERAVLMDYGFQGLNISSYLAGKYAEGAFGIRIIDPVTGKVLARARSFEVGMFGGEKLQSTFSDLGPEEKMEELKSVFTRLVKRLTGDALSKLGFEANIASAAEGNPLDTPHTVDGAKPVEYPKQAGTDSAGEKSSFAQRLRDLDALYKENLITREEYETKKQEILK